MASPRWRFELITSATMGRLGEIDQARDRQLTLAYLKPGGASFTIPANYEMFSGVEPIKHGIIAYRNDIAKWSGMIWNIDEQLGDLTGRIPVTVVGWPEILNHRVFRQDVSYPPLGVGSITGGGVVFADPSGTPGTQGYFPGGLLTIANAQRNTWIIEGTNADKMNRVVTYANGESIGSAFNALVDVEAGFDWTLDPLSRVMDIRNWDAYPDYSSTAHFGYNRATYNVAQFGRQFDASTIVNRMTAMGKYGGGLAEDIPSQNNYQLFEEFVQLSDVVDPNVLLGFAGGEVVLRSSPRIIYSLQPFPYSPGGSVPEPFVDYDLGGKILVSAYKAPRLDLQNQAMRVFGMNFSITNEGNEKLGALAVTP